MKGESTALAQLILEKERKEKATRRLKWIVGGSLVLAVSVGIWGFKFVLTSKRGTTGIAVYSSSELSLQRVASLLDGNPEGIVVKDTDDIKIDTIRSVNEYALLVAAISDEKKKLPKNEAEELAGTIPAPQATPAVSVSRDEQRSSTPALKVSEPLTEADIMPSFPGGEAALYQFLSKQIRYPRQAVKNKVEGTVYVRFVIDPDGVVKKAEVMRGIGHGCDEEALRVVQGMPRWNPGELAGQKVPVYSSLAVNFKFL